MIYLVHGQDQTSSYLRVREIVKNFPRTSKTYYSREATEDELYMAIFGQNLLEEKTVIIVENFLKDKKLNLDDGFFKRIPKEKTVIFWEQSEVTSSMQKKLQTLAKIENFKLPATIFRFLDSLAPGSKKPLVLLSRLEAEKEEAMLWHLANRVFLLILARFGLNISEVSRINDRVILDWQWNLIVEQSRLFKLRSLLDFFGGILKADLIVKSGNTELDQITLSSLLILKYL